MYRVTVYEDINDVMGTIVHYPNRSDIKLIAGDIAQGINVVDSFIFTMGMECPVYTSVRSLSTLVTVFNTKTSKYEFDGYVMQQNGDYSTDGGYSKTVTCVSGFNYLKHSKQQFGEFHDTTPAAFLQKLLDVHNSQVESYKQFKLGTVDVTNSTDNVYRYTDQEATTFDTIFDKLESRLGGEFRVRNENGQWYLDWLITIGSVKQTEIAVGRNLESASRDENTDSVVTRWMIYGATLTYKNGVIDSFDTLGNGTRVAVIEIEGENSTLPVNATLLPVGADVGSYISIAGTAPDYSVKLRDLNEVSAGAASPRLTIASVNGGKDYIDDLIGITQFGVQVGHVTFDEVTNKTTLLSKGIAHIQDYKQVTISNTVSALDLSLIGQDIDAYEVYNSYPLNNSGLSAKETIRVVQKRININSPESSTLTIGDTFQTASEYQASSRKSTKGIQALQSTVKNQALSIATLTTSNITMSTNYNALQVSYNNLAATLEIDDTSGTSIALYNIQQAISDLGGDIVSYGLATISSDGLMSAVDKAKLNNMQNYALATQSLSGLLGANDKTKLDRITVTGSIDLDNILLRIIDLETP